MESSIYPSDTVHFSPQSTEDDDVSTLSGSSSAQSPKASRQKKIHSPRKSKSRLNQSYLNGKLPLDVKKDLQIKRTNSKEEKQKGIPFAININMEKENDNRNDVCKEESEVHTPNTPSFSEPAVSKEREETNKLQTKSPQSMSSVDIAMSSKTTDPLSKTPQSLRRERLEKMKGKMYSESRHGSQSDITNYVSSMDTIGMLKSAKETLDSERKKASSRSNRTVSAIKAMQEELVEISSIDGDGSPKSQLQIHVSSGQKYNHCVTPEKQQPTKATKYNSPMSEKSSVISKSDLSKKSLIDDCSLNSHKENKIHTPHSRNVNGNVSTNTIHRSFWNVPVSASVGSPPPPPPPRLSRNNKRERIPLPAPPSLDSTEQMSRLRQLVSEYNTPSPSLRIRKKVEEDSGDLGPCTIPKHTKNSPSKESLASTSSTISRTTGTSQEDSIRSFEDFYEDIMKKIKCSPTKFSTACNETSIINDPPILKRLLREDDTCVCGAIEAETYSHSTSSPASSFEDNEDDNPVDNGFEVSLKSSASRDKPFSEKHSIASVQHNSTFTDDHFDLLKDDSRRNYKSAYDLLYNESLSCNMTKTSARDKYKSTRRGLHNDAQSYNASDTSETDGSSSVNNSMDKTYTWAPADEIQIDHENDISILTEPVVSEKQICVDKSSKSEQVGIYTVIDNTRNLRRARLTKSRILKTPAKSIVKKIKKATARMKNSQRRRKDLYSNLGDNLHLLSEYDEKQMQRQEAFDPWGSTSSSPRKFQC
ncbi:predicted protein [Chaetoceros tenuissimus]|uniref:Uncharacterized protein n=1 Tax=Chaetoceros tenuissimus TaxID=426638 RepID=A0AAD3CVV0_9STRA|nr:predicted protein [Chaetoceros tenuissimus]